MLGIEPRTSPMFDKPPATEIASQALQMVFAKTIWREVGLQTFWVNLNLFPWSHLPNSRCYLAPGPSLQLVLKCVFSPWMFCSFALKINACSVVCLLTALAVKPASRISLNLGFELWLTNLLAWFTTLSLHFSQGFMCPIGSKLDSEKEPTSKWNYFALWKVPAF